MELKKYKQQVLSWVRKYRYAVLILLLGILLMVFPASQQEDDTADSASNLSQPVIEDIAVSLEEILSQIQGVGKVKVMLTYAVGAETIYQENIDSATSENGTTIQKDTVIISGADRGEQALISYVKPPVYLGAIIVCQGADQANIKLAVLDAVSKATGLSSDKISIVKMK